MQSKIRIFQLWRKIKKVKNWRIWVSRVRFSYEQILDVLIQADLKIGPVKHRVASFNLFYFILYLILSFVEKHLQLTHRWKFET